MSRRSRIVLSVSAAIAILIASAVLTAVYLRPAPAGPDGASAALPQPGSEIYGEMVSAFYSGIAALDVDAKDRARTDLTRATELVPKEPAAWANLGLLDLQLNDLDAAERVLTIARELAPENGPIERLLGLLAGFRGEYALAAAHFRRAVALNPDDLKSRFSLIHEVERLGEPKADSDALSLAGELVAKAPLNLVVLLERVRLAVKCVDVAVLGDSVTRLGRLAPAWPQNAQQQYRDLEREVKSKPQSAALAVVRLRNVLLQTPGFKKDLAIVQTLTASVADPITTFVRLAPPPPTPSPPDETISYDVRAIDTPGLARCDSVVAVPLAPDQPPVVFAADGRVLRRLGTAIDLPLPGKPAAPPSPHSILAVDWNSDYRMDFVFAGGGGLKLWLQKDDGSFADVTTASGLDAGILSAAYFGAWAADIEMDGDLDFVLGSAADARVNVLRNNGDGSFSPVQPFGLVAALRDFAWADLDQDGDPDAAFLDAKGIVHVYTNERAGQFRLRPGMGDSGTAVALAVADLDADGQVDLLALQKSGTIVRATEVSGKHSWQEVGITPAPASAGASSRLFVADLDNNGALDLIVSGVQGGWIGMGGKTKDFQALSLPQDLHVFDVTDFDADGRLDLLGLTSDGRPALGNGRGTKGYHWQVIRPRGAKVFGDARINSFGLGGEIEVRAGLLVQKQVINGPAVHFGLGDRHRSDVARIIWPNGTSQVEFDSNANLEVIAQQRLSGSCPFLYAFDGQSVRFVTDFIWRSPLGLRINAQDTAGAGETQDWVKIRGDQLSSRDGTYDVRITAELWETHYFDAVSLMVVDHPRGSEVFVDERFARQPPPLVVHATGRLYPIASAHDDRARDVLEDVIARDGRYLDGFGRGFYQGITRDHWVEVELGDEVPRDGPLWLVAHGWIHPTDSSINVAIGQGRGPKPQGLVLEVPGANGGWTVARPDLGFPAGKNKTILVDLTGIFPPQSGTRRFRLRTNLEIFWDSLGVARAAPDAAIRTQRLAPQSAELRFRGYSKMTQAGSSSPELPDYDSITGTTQRWQDLIGFYTRFGDVRELLKEVDDRYVIANAGDELALRFPAPPAPEEGTLRDFVLIGDGWNKDGNFNTAFSKTVLPLPSHKRPGYDGPLTSLEDDPVFRFHPEDWREYHTRYVTPGEFQNALRPHLNVLVRAPGAGVTP
jgi:tetratricopeptide (TPR) repeat protein